MASRRIVRGLAGALALFGCGVWALMAWRGGLYANLALSLLGAAWVGALMAFSPTGGPILPRTILVRGEDPGRWRALVDQAPSPLLFWPPEGGPRAANRAARVLFGADDKIVGPLADLLPVRESLEPGQPRTVTLPTPLGERLFSLAVTEVEHRGQLVRLGALSDIQAEVHAAEAKALRDLLTVLNHEIMNSLTPVASLAETASDYLQDETSSSARAARDALAVLARRAQGLARFVEGYRAMARLPPPQLRPTDLGRLLGDVAEMIRLGRGEAGLVLTYEPPAQPMLRDLDPDLVTQALLNILGNAAEAVASAVDPRVSLSLRPIEGRAEILIEDNGPGVPADRRDQIFQPLVTTKPGGFGVGLSLARQIALSHGGDITLPSPQPARGARFRMVL